MGKALHVWSNAVSAIASGNEGWITSGSVVGATEANAQGSFRQAGTFSLLGTNNMGGNGANTVQLRVAGANGNLVVTRTGTGYQEDSANSDTISANTLLNFAFTDTGTNPTYGAIKFLFAASGDHCAYYGSAASGGQVCDVASTTVYIPFAGNFVPDGHTSEARTQLKSRATGTLRSFQVRVTANARTNDSTFRTRKNTANGNGLITFATGVTGLVIDDANTDTLADGDLFNASLTLDTGVQDLTVSIVAAAITNASAAKNDLFCFLNAATRAASATAHYQALGGFTSLAQTTEANFTIQPGFAGTASNLGIYLAANTYAGSCTFVLRKNGAAAITLTITAGQTGWLENTTDTATFAATDTLCYELDEGTSGSITVEMMRVTVQDGAAAGAVALTGRALIATRARPNTSAARPATARLSAQLRARPTTSAARAVKANLLATARSSSTASVVRLISAAASVFGRTVVSPRASAQRSLAARMAAQARADADTAAARSVAARVRGGVSAAPDASADRAMQARVTGAARMAPATSAARALSATLRGIVSSAPTLAVQRLVAATARIAAHATMTAQAIAARGLTARLSGALTATGDAAAARKLAGRLTARATAADTVQASRGMAARIAAATAVRPTLSKVGALAAAARIAGRGTMTATAQVSRAIAARIATRMAGGPQASAARGIAARLLAVATVSPSFGAARLVSAAARIAGRGTMTARATAARGLVARLHTGSAAKPAASATRGLSARVFHRIAASARFLIGTPDQRTFAVGAVARTITVAARAAIAVGAAARSITVASRRGTTNPTRTRNIDVTD